MCAKVSEMDQEQIFNKTTLSALLQHGTESLRRRHFWKQIPAGWAPFERTRVRLAAFEYFLSVWSSAAEKRRHSRVDSLGPFCSRPIPDQKVMYWNACERGKFYITVG